MSIPKITNEGKALEAVKQNGWALKYVQKEFKTAKLCMELVKTLFKETITIVPEQLREKILSMFASSLTKRGNEAE